MFERKVVCTIYGSVEEANGEIHMHSNLEIPVYDGDNIGAFKGTHMRWVWDTFIDRHLNNPLIEFHTLGRRTSEDKQNLGCDAMMMIC
jgi:hypothetical protein